MDAIWFFFDEINIFFKVNFFFNISKIITKDKFESIIWWFLNWFWFLKLNKISKYMIIISELFWYMLSIYVIFLLRFSQSNG